MEREFKIDRKQDLENHKRERPTYEIIKTTISEQIERGNRNSELLVLKCKQGTTKSTKQIELQLELLEEVGIELPFKENITLFNIWLYEKTPKPNTYLVYKWGYCPIVYCFSKTNKTLTFKVNLCSMVLPFNKELTRSIVYLNKDDTQVEKKVNLDEIELCLKNRTNEYKSIIPMPIQELDKLSHQAACHSITIREFTHVNAFIKQETELLIKRLGWSPCIDSLISTVMTDLVSESTTRLSLKEETIENFEYDIYLELFPDKKKKRFKGLKCGSLYWPGIEFEKCIGTSLEPWMQDPFMCKIQLGYWHFHPLLWFSYTIKLFTINLRKKLNNMIIEENNKTPGEILRESKTDYDFIQYIKKCDSTFIPETTITKNRIKIKPNYSCNPVKDIEELALIQPGCMESLYRKAYNFDEPKHLLYEDRIRFYSFALKNGINPETLITSLTPKAMHIKNDIKYVEGTVVRQVESMYRRMNKYDSFGCESTMKTGLCPYFKPSEITLQTSATVIDHKLDLARKGCHAAMQLRHGKHDTSKWKQGHGPVAVAQHQKEMLSMPS